MTKTVSINEYAKHRGVSMPAIFNAIRRGKLTGKSAKKVDGVWRIDLTAADLELSANHQPHNGGDRRSKSAKESRPKSQENSAKKTRAPENSESNLDEDDEEADGKSETFMQAKTRREILNADLAALELAEKEARLVPKAEVEREAFKVARMVRDSLLNIPDRVAAELAAETNQFRVHERLKLELRRAMEGLKIDD